MEAGALQAPAGLSRISIAAPLLRLRTDDQLVALFRAGHEDAFQVIFDRYRQRLFAYTRQMLAGSRQDAEDALQDVFLRAYGALRANDRPVSLRAWLYRVAHNRCIDQLRRPVPASADVFDVSRAPLKDPLEESQRREDLRRLVEDVRRLPEAQRSALLMREMEGLSYNELAAALDVTVPAVKSLLVRARIGLVEAIEARDTACADIRNDLLTSYDKGVRATGKARRHLRDCTGCRAYRTQLRSVQRGLGALSPGHPGPLGLVAKVFGIGGGAAAGGTTAIVGGGGAVVGGGAATVTACKVAALVCSAALVTGAAGGFESAVRHVVATQKPAVHASSAGPAAGTLHTAAATPHASLTAPHIIRLPSRSAAGATAAATAAGGPEHRRTHKPVAESGRDEPSAAVAFAHHEARVISNAESGGTPTQTGTPTQAGTPAAATPTPASAGPGDTVGGGVKAPDEPTSAPASPAPPAATAPAAPAPATSTATATGSATAPGPGATVSTPPAAATSGAAAANVAPALTGAGAPAG
ncbi:MAG: RNA polymerase sigma factor [Solirubrobacterales bacterium]